MSEQISDCYAPRWEGGTRREDFESYRRRVSRLLPNVPVEPLRDWLHQHYEGIADDWGWLPMERLRFAIESWDTTTILRDVAVTHPKSVESWYWSFRCRRNYQETSLGRFMIAHATWPTRPLILRVPASERPAHILPLHLMEGHHRVAYLRALRDDSRWRAADWHEVWAVTFGPREAAAPK
jgi:hypothetical protein